MLTDGDGVIIGNGMTLMAMNGSSRRRGVYGDDYQEEWIQLWWVPVVTMVMGCEGG